MVVFSLLDSISKRFNIFLTSVFNESNTNSQSQKKVMNGNIDAPLLEYCLQNHREITQNYILGNKELGFAEDHPSFGDCVQVAPELQKKQHGRELLMF